MTNKEISADYWPITKDKAIKLIPAFKLKDIPKGTVLYTVGGDEITVSDVPLDGEVRVFGRSRFGKLIEQ